VSSTTPVDGNEVDFTLAVDNIGTQSALQTHLVFTLPSTMKLLGPPSFQSGAGCTGTATVDCNLDYVPAGSSTSVKFGVIVSGSGTQTVTATVTSDHESDPSDNSATVTLQVGGGSATPTPTPTPLPMRGKTVTGTAGADVLVGTPYADVLNGAGGDDVIRGGGGSDVLNGGAGADRLYGGPGNDVLIGGPGPDRLFGGAGDDTIRARDGVRDVVDCGAGRDTVTADRKDVVSRNCEIVHRS
jgi:Ca2+-binding RTX toxin-like protein